MLCQMSAQLCAALALDSWYISAAAAAAEHGTSRSIGTLATHVKAGLPRLSTNPTPGLAVVNTKPRLCNKPKEPKVPL